MSKTYLVHAVGQLSCTLKLEYGEDNKPRIQFAVEPTFVPDVNVQCFGEVDKHEVRMDMDDKTAHRVAVLSITVAMTELLRQYTKHMEKASEMEPTFVLPQPEGVV